MAWRLGRGGRNTCRGEGSGVSKRGRERTYVSAVLSPTVQKASVAVATASSGGTFTRCCWCCRPGKVWEGRWEAVKRPCDVFRCLQAMPMGWIPTTTISYGSSLFRGPWKRRMKASMACGDATLKPCPGTRTSHVKHRGHPSPTSQWVIGLEVT